MILSVGRLTGVVLVLVVLVPALYLGHLYKNYRKIQKESAIESAVIVRPAVGDTDVSEIGYIYEMRRESSIREAKLNLVWFVVVPATGVHYSCGYEESFSDFNTGDSVRIIHTTKDEADDGYVVGLYGKEKGEAAMTWTFNSDQDIGDSEP